MNTTIPAPPSKPATGLALIALGQGVSFDDVQAFCEGQGETRPGWIAAWYETINEPPYENLTDALRATCESMHTDTVLGAALERSAHAAEAGRIEAARVWWQGVL